LDLPVDDRILDQRAGLEQAGILLGRLPQIRHPELGHQDVSNARHSHGITSPLRVRTSFTRSGGPRPEPLPLSSWRPRRRPALLPYAARFGSLTPASAASWRASVGFSFMSRICSVRFRVSGLNGFTRAEPPALPLVAPLPLLPEAGRNGAASS